MMKLETNYDESSFALISYNNIVETHVGWGGDCGGVDVKTFAISGGMLK